ncbi:hypothetical protein Clacol_008218 [Clathrus columnatus]|uniref:Uncharacterized protein n=1 Tax=Clathrus columnatus TaxID=1419009 RepID=A0AAV5AM17_9AGAM|nr:hypothetical protein Clacol_008218 [Clathrus columnatus]
MPSLLDAIDRLAYTANSLNIIALDSQQEDASPFTQAMLYSSLQNIIREADETEYNLFTFVNDASHTPLEGQGRLGRKDFGTATPLKTHRTNGMIKDEEPEVYLEATLRYLDGFYTIKPLPGMRAHLQSLVDRLNNARDQLEEVQESMQLIQREGNYSFDSQIREEEKRINELKVKVLQLRKRVGDITISTFQF